MENEIIEIVLPLWVQIVGSIGSFALLWKLVTFSDVALPNCGWCGHQGLENSHERDNL